MKLECGVCCETSSHRLIQCVHCGYRACPSCVETFLLGSSNDPSCMNCRSVWDILFLRKELDHAFLNGAYQDHRQDLLWKRFHYRVDSSVFCPCPSCPYGKIHRETNTCSVCWTRVCGDCLSVCQEEGHVCPKDVISSLQEIARFTKQCPGCHAPIEKLSGCFQMFCTQCYTPFDWKDGRILEKKTLHNPHYFEHQSISDNILPNLHQHLHREFYFLLLDIEKQIHFLRSPDNFSSYCSREELFFHDQNRLQTHCQLSLWSTFHKKGWVILRSILSGKSARPEIRQFENDLKEALLDYNEHVANCVLLRGLRLFSHRPLIVC